MLGDLRIIKLIDTMAKVFTLSFGIQRSLANPSSTCNYMVFVIITSDASSTIVVWEGKTICVHWCKMFHNQIFSQVDWCKLSLTKKPQHIKVQLCGFQVKAWAQIFASYYISTSVESKIVTIKSEVGAIELKPIKSCICTF